MTVELAGLGKFESRGSTLHSHYDGREIQRIFYLENYSKAAEVVEAMLGSVTGSTRDWTRHFPAQYPGHPECYCNEVKVSQIDPRAIAFSTSLGLNDLREEIGTADWRYDKFMYEVYSVPDDPAGGCFLTASFRPLISARKIAPFVASPSDEPDAEEKWEQSERSKLWDWIGPHFTPEVRTVPWPDGLQIAAKPGLNLFTGMVPDEVANPISIPAIGFTVKRLLVGEVPWRTLNALTNTVNHAAWPVEPELYTIPQFARGTLRFDDFEVVEHYSPAASGGLWFEIVLHFSWISYRSTEVWDENGICSKDQVADVGWNHVLMKPLFGKIEWGEGILPPSLGWYFAMIVKRNEWISEIPLFTLQLGPIHPFADFDHLFNLNAV